MTIQATLNTEIEANLPSNTSGAITATVLRTTLHDINNNVPYPDLGNTWTATQVMPNLAIPVAIGPLPFVQANSYTAGASGASILAVQGSTGTPKTSAVANVVVQSVVNVASDSAQAVYVSLIRSAGSASIDHRGVYVEVKDTQGSSGSSMSGGRFTGTLTGGTSGNMTGATLVALTTVPYKFLVGAEHQLFQNSGTDATTSYTAAKFSTGALASNLGANIADAGFMTNPDSPGTPGKDFITGFLVATNGLGAGNDTVIDTAFRNDASLVYGMDLSRGVYSGAPVVAPLTTPSSSSATGKAGAICWDAGFIYICTATNTWKRTALSTF